MLKTKKLKCLRTFVLAIYISTKLNIPCCYKYNCSTTLYTHRSIISTRAVSVFYFPLLLIETHLVNNYYYSVLGFNFY